MRISFFQLENYKSFFEAQKLELQPGFNFIVGQNNLGKTALLEALTLGVEGNPHRSRASLPDPTSPMNPISTMQVDVVVKGEELRNILLSHVSGVNLPYPENKPQEPRIAEDILDSLLSQPEITLRLTVSSPVNGSGSLVPRESPSHGLYACNTSSGNLLHAQFRVAPDRSGFLFSSFVSAGRDQEFSNQLGNLLRQRIYFFRAERLTLSRGPIGNNPILAPNAGNLPEVLHLLQAKNPSRFRRLTKLLQRIFPSIEQVSVRPTAGNPVEHEIVVWTEDPESEREDLAIELSSSGTGVGQVLAILYVILNSTFPRAFVIDEPNSFLHPSAARRLMEILTEFPQHQYVLSTHSPEILSAVTPATLTLIRWQKPRSVLDHLNPAQLSDLQKCLFEIGVRLSDVFGADNILWVEGPTEEECFERILRALVRTPWAGTRIVAVKNTGDFHRKQKDVALIVEVYRKLTSAGALIPPAIGFEFDREGLSAKEQAELVRLSNGKLKFLPRRMYENYLLDTEAIAAVLNSLPAFLEARVTSDRVQNWIRKNGADEKYLCRDHRADPVFGEAWLENVHAAELLSDLFVTLSNAKEEFRKPVHPVQLTQWLIQNKRQQLTELCAFIEDCLTPV